MKPTADLHPFELKVKEFINCNGLINEKSPVIIGLSGGADSVALTVVLHRLGFDCHAAHCNFHLRGEESDRDECFVREFTSSISIPLEVVHFDVNKYIEDVKKPTSLEMACRELRYDWFESLRLRHKSQTIAVAHNADDNIETVMLNMLRGTGIAGIRGMLPINNKHVIRPFLSVYRTEIEAYLKDMKTDFVTDSTNLESDFSRNKLRNRVLPILFELFPDGKKGFTSTISLIRQINGFYKSSIEDQRNEFFISDTEIDIEALRHDANAKLLLYEWLQPYGISSEQTAEILEGTMRSGKRFFCKNGYFLLDRGKLSFIESDPSDHESIPFDSLFKIEIHSGNKIEYDRSSLTSYFDSSVIDMTKLECRYWQTGDRIKPFGMKGSKKLSDIFSDAKIPLNIKAEIPLLTYNDEILWVPGLRASRVGLVTEDTNSYISVHYIGPKLF